MPTFATDQVYWPFFTNEIYSPDSLVYDTRLVVTETATLPANSGVIARGTVLGKQTLGAPSAAVAGGSNTGNATVSTVTAKAGAQLGTYAIAFTSATAFTVHDPLGNALATGHTGTAYATQIGFTITVGGTAMVAGDTFAVTLAAGSGNLAPSVATAGDGSEYPVAILSITAPNSASAQTINTYVAGEFDANALIFDASWSVATLTPVLQARRIYLKQAEGSVGPNY